MNKVPLTLSFENEKLEAMEIFLKKDGSSVQKKMEDALKSIYEEVVPAPVREFIDARAGTKPKRPTSAKSTPKHKIEPEKKATAHEQS